MNIELSDKDFRFLLDLVYIGNWILNSTRDNDRIEEYEALEEKIFAYCAGTELQPLISVEDGAVYPSKDYEEGGIQEAIADYEDAVFFEILAEELARRDMKAESVSQDNFPELSRRVDEYIAEFEKNGVKNLSVEMK